MDSKNKKDFHDRDRININEEYEVKYWTKRLGIDKALLEKAVSEVGPMVKDVQAFLQNKV